MGDMFPLAGETWKVWLTLVGSWLFWNSLFAWFLYLLFAMLTGMTDCRAMRWGHTIGGLLGLLWLLLCPWPFQGLNQLFLFWAPGEGLQTGPLIDFGVVSGVTMIWLVFGVWLIGNPER
ncbi:MAG: hypothetical protein FJX74_07000 [Armatimonadetes bacterium]|nr:hypothetical protein [Armatimonadota bacterium]